MQKGKGKQERDWLGGSWRPHRASTVAWTGVAVGRGGSRGIQDMFWSQNEQVLPELLTREQEETRMASWVSGLSPWMSAFFQDSYHVSRSKS